MGVGGLGHLKIEGKIVVVAIRLAIAGGHHYIENITGAGNGAARDGSSHVFHTIFKNSIPNEECTCGSGITCRERAHGEGQLVVGKGAVKRTVRFYAELIGSTSVVEIQHNGVLTSGGIDSGNRGRQACNVAVALGR